MGHFTAYGTPPKAPGVGGKGFFGTVVPRPTTSGWVARSVPTLAASWSSNVVAGGGVALLIDSNSALWKSTDGGATWVSGAHTFTGSPYQCAYSAGTFLVVSSTGVVSRSTNGGTTWTTRTISATTAITPASDGAGNWLITSSTTFNTSTSADDGQTWTLHTIAGGGTAVVSTIWDGTQFVWSGTNVGGVAIITTSPDGITPTRHTIVPNTDLFNNTLTFQGGVYNIPFVDFATNSVRNAATPAALCNAATTVDTGLTGNPANGLSCLLAGNGILWAFDSAGGVAGSTDNGATWTPSQLNFAPGAAPNSLFQAYDATHHQFIAVGGFDTSVSTHPDSGVP